MLFSSSTVIISNMYSLDDYINTLWGGPQQLMGETSHSSWNWCHTTVNILAIEFNVSLHSIVERNFLTSRSDWRIEHVRWPWLPTHPDSFHHIIKTCFKEISSMPAGKYTGNLAWWKSKMKVFLHGMKENINKHNPRLLFNTLAKLLKLKNVDYFSATTDMWSRVNMTSPQTGLLNHIALKQCLCPRIAHIWQNCSSLQRIWMKRSWSASWQTAEQTLLQQWRNWAGHGWTALDIFFSWQWQSQW